MTFAEKIRAEIENEQMIHQGERVLVGLSGGADSVALLCVLNELAEELGISLCAVHVMHGIRGKEAEEDALFSRSLCVRKKIPFYIREISVPAMVKETGMSVEEAAREARYRIFRAIAQREHADKIAVAHHLEDNAETMLFQLIRGSALTGLGGMAPCKDGIIRPLLGVRREEIYEYLQSIGQDYRIDHTNLETDYTRNKIRLEIMPLLEEINPKAQEHMHRAAGHIRKADDYLNSHVERLEKQYVRYEGNSAEIETAPLRQVEQLLADEVYYRTLANVRGSRKDLAHIHVTMLQELSRMQTGSRMDLPGFVTAVRTYSGIKIQKDRIHTDLQQDPEHDISDEAVLLDLNARRQSYSFGGYHISAQILNRSALQNVDFETQNPYTKYIDYDKIKIHMAIRLPQQGDIITVDGAGNTKKLNRYFIDKKVLADERARKVLLMDGNQVVWVIGDRIGYPYRISEETTRVWMLHAERENHE